MNANREDQREEKDSNVQQDIEATEEDGFPLYHSQFSVLVDFSHWTFELMLLISFGISHVLLVSMLTLFLVPNTMQSLHLNFEL